MADARYLGGRNRLAEHQVQRVQRLLAVGNSAREVARLTEVSYDSILKIARGEHDGGSDKLKRCDNCRGLVRLPCLLCGLRIVKPAR